MDFIDIRGGSGSLYRFRRWPENGAVPPIAGNYALVARGSRQILSLGVLDDLSKAPSVVATRERGAEIFTRYNVARLAREAEHDDIMLAHPDLGAAPAKDERAA
jgi:hypothetical protein